MKILHTSDWHLGHLLYNFSQDEAHRDMLQQLENIVKEEQPDLFLLAGDVYDTLQPSTSAQTMLADALVNIHKANEKMTIVCIAGNHDSGSKHMIFNKPWKTLNVNMIGTINRDSNLDDYIIEVENVGFVVAVPYAAERFLPDDVYQALYARVEDRNRDKQLPVVLMAHLAVKGCDSRGHDHSTDTIVGNLNCQDASIFGDGYDYVALGHIHSRQDLLENNRVCYSGTPIAVSFDEKPTGHSVSLVECAKHGDTPAVKCVEINNINPLITLPETGYADWEKAQELLKDFPKDTPAYIRLNVEVDDYLPAGANDTAQSLVQGKACKLCNINSKRKEKTVQSGDNKTFTTSEFKGLDLVEVAKMWIESKGEVLDPELEEMLQELKTKISTSNNNQ